MLEHVATGKFYLGVSKNVSVEVDRCLSDLGRGKFRNKSLNRLYGSDDEIQVYELPCKPSKQKGLFSFLKDIPPIYNYLLLNEKRDLKGITK